MGDNERKAQVEGLRRRVALLERENQRLRAAVEFTVKTLDLHRDPTANPLARMCDRDIAERMLREALTSPGLTPPGEG